MNLQDFKDELSRESHGMTALEAKAKGICINCKQPPGPKCHSAADVNEYAISGLCGECFDEICKEPDDEGDGDAPVF